jgi:hypothetical protein
MIWNTVGLIFKHLELALRIQAASPHLDVATASAHVTAATAAASVASGPVTTELLLGVAFIESRYNPTAVSRVVGHTRRTGPYPSLTPPARLNRRASLYCGPLQTYASSWAMCLGMRDLPTAYRAGARELQDWLADRRVRGDVRRALAGHGCGNHGVNTGGCNRYPTRVLAMERRLRGGAPPQHSISSAAVASR